MGRPSSYTPEIAEEILDRLASGESLRTICASSEDFPDIRSVMRWLRKDEDFRQQYARAREIWADSVVDECQHIADTPQEGVIVKELKDGSEEITREDMLGHRKLQIDTRKWAAARMSPRKYGDSSLMKLGDAEGNALQPITLNIIPVAAKNAPQPPSE